MSVPLPLGPFCPSPHIVPPALPPSGACFLCFRLPHLRVALRATRMHARSCSRVPPPARRALRANEFRAPLVQLALPRASPAVLRRLRARVEVGEQVGAHLLLQNEVPAPAKRRPQRQAVGGRGRSHGRRTFEAKDACRWHDLPLDWHYTFPSSSARNPSTYPLSLIRSLKRKYPKEQPTTNHTLFRLVLSRFLFSAGLQA